MVAMCLELEGKINIIEKSRLLSHALRHWCLGSGVEGGGRVRGGSDEDPIRPVRPALIMNPLKEEEVVVVGGEV